MNDMTTTASGGKITGLLALTMNGVTGLNIGDPVMVTSDYTCSLADGTKPIVGYVSVTNVKRVSTVNSTTFPVANPGGAVTVEALGFSVKQHLSGAALTPGTKVGINSSGALVAAGAGVANLGIVLNTASASGQLVDVLVQGF